MKPPPSQPTGSTASLTADSQRAAAGQRGAVHLHGVAGGQAGANDQGFRDRREESEGSHGAVQEILNLELRRERDRLGEERASRGTSEQRRRRT